MGADPAGLRWIGAGDEQAATRQVAGRSQDDAARQEAETV
jgi:hypothetical protein